MSSMQLPKFQIPEFFAFVVLFLLMTAVSCSRPVQRTDALGVVVTGGEAGLAEAGQAGQSAPASESVPSGGQASAAASAPAAAILARAEKTLPYPDRADFDRLDAVLERLSERAREAMPLTASNRAEFLTDLQQVLEAEKSFRTDDLSLYYLIDKKHNVGADYVPKDLVHLDKNDLFDINKNNLSLRPEAYGALCDMAEASLRDGVRLLVSSTYRSYEYQTWLFQHWVDVDGLEEAERESARAGTSQHQLGVAVDFGSVSDDFADTVMGQWVYAHSEEFGWSLSFPQGYEDVTGFRWESWHFRYIGRPACDFQRKWFSDVQQFMIGFIDAWKNS